MRPPLVVGMLEKWRRDEGAANLRDFRARPDSNSKAAYMVRNDTWLQIYEWNNASFWSMERREAVVDSKTAHKPRVIIQSTL